MNNTSNSLHIQRKAIEEWRQSVEYEIKGEKNGHGQDGMTMGRKHVCVREREGEREGMGL